MRLQFRVWDKEKQEMLYSGFVIRDGNPDCLNKEYVSRMAKIGQVVEYREDGTMGAEPLEFPSTMEINDKITDLMEPNNLGGASWSLIDWSNWYGLNNYVVMQATGFHDSNGNLIWEDDILVDKDGIESDVIWHYGCYIWNGGMIADYNSCFQGDRIGLDTKELTIIGNKWERNKDQLKLPFEVSDEIV